MGQFALPPLETFVVQNYGWKMAVLMLAGFALLCVIWGALMRPLEKVEDKTSQPVPLHIRGWGPKTKKTKKIIQPFSRKDFFYLGSVQKMMKVDNATTTWDENRHLLYSKYVFH